MCLLVRLGGHYMHRLSLIEGTPHRMVARMTVGHVGILFARWVHKQFRVEWEGRIHNLK